MARSPFVSGDVNGGIPGSFIHCFACVIAGGRQSKACAAIEFKSKGVGWLFFVLGVVVVIISAETGG